MKIEVDVHVYGWEQGNQIMQNLPSNNFQKTLL
jgi:hypothetical protein